MPNGTYVYSYDAFIIAKYLKRRHLHELLDLREWNKDVKLSSVFHNTEFCNAVIIEMQEGS